MSTFFLGVLVLIGCCCVVFATSYSVLYWMFQWVRMRVVWCLYLVKGVNFFPQKTPLHDEERPLYIPTVMGRVKGVLVDLQSENILDSFDDLIFLDCGCGKGSVLLDVSCLGFKKIVGIEIDPDLYRVCVGNIQRLGLDSRVELIKGDYFDDPKQFDRVNVIYAYGQFNYNQLGDFCEVLNQSLMQCPRPFFLVYTHLSHRQVLESNGFECVYEKYSAKFGDYCTSVWMSDAAIGR